MKKTDIELVHSAWTAHWIVGLGCQVLSMTVTVQISNNSVPPKLGVKALCWLCVCTQPRQKTETKQCCRCYEWAALIIVKQNIALCNVWWMIAPVIGLQSTKSVIYEFVSMSEQVGKWWEGDFWTTLFSNRVKVLNGTKYVAHIIAWINNKLTSSLNPITKLFPCSVCSPTLYVKSF